MTNEELKANGINPEDPTYPFGEMNVIVHCFGQSSDENERENENYQIYPDVYQPRNNRVVSYGSSNYGISIKTESEKADYIKHLKDSVGRLRIMALLLEKQVRELEENGYFTTDCYYADVENL